MKLLKYTVFRSCKHEEVGLVGEVCRCNVFNSSMTYVGILGVLGVFLSLHDLIKMLSNGKIISCSIIRGGLKSLTNNASPTLKRDLKLISLVLSLQYYLFLIIGSLLRNYIFFIPWMLYYTIIISLEFGIYLWRILQEGTFCDKHAIIISIFVAYNWLAVFCAFYQLSDESNNKSYEY